eukprot:528382_1
MSHIPKGSCTQCVMQSKHIKYQTRSRSHQTRSELILSITSNVLTSHADDRRWISKNYAMLSGPQHHILDDKEFVALLMLAYSPESQYVTVRDRCFGTAFPHVHIKPNSC